VNGATRKQRPQYALGPAITFVTTFRLAKTSLSAFLLDEPSLKLGQFTMCISWVGAHFHASMYWQQFWANLGR
jgi:hypothetical protein